MSSAITTNSCFVNFGPTILWQWHYSHTTEYNDTQVYFNIRILLWQIQFSHIWVYIIYVCWWHTKALLIIKWYTNSTQKKIFSSSPPQLPCTEILSITDFSYIWCFMNFYDSSCNRKCIQGVIKKLPDLRKRIFSELKMLGRHKYDHRCNTRG